METKENKSLAEACDKLPLMNTESPMHVIFGHRALVILTGMCTHNSLITL